MNKEHFAASLLTMFLIAVVLILAAEGAMPAYDARASIASLQKQIDEQKHEIDSLKLAQATKEQIGAASAQEIMDLRKDLEEKEPKSAFEEVAFYAATFIAILTCVITVYALVVGLMPLLKIEDKMEEIAKHKFKELNSLLTGRLHYAMSIIFSKVTWDTTYTVRCAAIDLGDKALQSATNALGKYRELGTKEYRRYEMWALNNVLFYSALTKESSASPTEAREILRQAEELSKAPEVKDDADSILTYSLVCVSFYKYIGDCTPALITQKLDEVEKLLELNLHRLDLSPEMRCETHTVLERLKLKRQGLQ